MRSMHYIPGSPRTRCPMYHVPRRHLIPLDDKEHVQVILDQMQRYGNKWDIIFAPEKFKVLAFGDINEHFFYLGETKKASERTEKYLSLIIDTKGNWREHFRQNIKNANSALGALLGAGLLGGSQPVHKALDVAKATVWTIVDSGRLATNYLSESKITRRK